MKFSCPLEFNDPFYCLPFYDTTDLERIPTIRPGRYKAAADRRGRSPADHEGFRRQFLARLRNRIQDGSFANEQLRRVGVVSLSRNARSILMWSHYAQFHQGFVLEFRIPKFGEHKDLVHADDRLLPLPVSYEENRPKIVVAQFNQEQLVHKILLTKSNVWSYEEEERVITDTRPGGIYPYRRDEILCSVIAGLKISDENYRTLESACAALRLTAVPSLALFRAKASQDQYDITVPGHPRLQRVVEVELAK